MQMNQIYNIVNTVTGEVLGLTDIVQEDLSNIVDIGKQIFDNNSFDKYVKSLVDHVGRVVFVDRVYAGSAPSVLMDGWEFGAVLEKIHSTMPAAQENESWELTDGEDYSQDIFKKPIVNAKFFNKYVTFEVPLSITERQVKSAFSNVMQLNAFLSMLYNEVDKSMTVKLDSLIMRTINNMIAETISDDYGTALLTSKSGVKAINLLYLYNTENSTTLTAEKAIKNPDFIRFASYEIGRTIARMKVISSLYNIGGQPRFTPDYAMHAVFLSDFYRSASVYLQSDVFHNQLTALPYAEEVPFWQGSGQDGSFAHSAYLNVKTASGKEIEVGGVLGVLFDRDALGVTNMNRRVTTHYNGRAEFTNSWYKMDAGYFNDFDENCVVFFMEYTPPTGG